MKKIKLAPYFSIFALIVLLSFSCKRSITDSLSTTKNSKTDTLPSSTNTPPQISNNSNVITLTITFNSSATGSSSSIPALKYNKKKWVTMTWDDNPATAFNLMGKLDSTHYTDNTGNALHYTAGIACNGVSMYDSAEIGGSLATGRGNLTYAQLDTLVAHGWDLINHGYEHDSINGGLLYCWGKYGSSWNLNQNDIFYLSKLNYKFNTVIVPTNWSGFMDAAALIGYVGGSSTGTFDKQAFYPQYNQMGYMSYFTKVNYQGIKRDFATDTWDSAGQSIPFMTANALIANNYTFFEEGTHAINMSTTEQNEIRKWINLLHNSLGDSLIMTGQREFLEYVYLKNHVTKTEVISGNQLQITIDYSSVPTQNFSWLDLSFIISSSTSIQSVESNNTSFLLTYNGNSKLINIKKRKTVW